MSEAPLLKPEQAKAFHEWQRKVQEQLPELANRVFALRGKMYTGCGFHYSMERQLGRAIIAAHPSNEYPTIFSEISDRLAVEMLFNDVKKAEKSAAEWAAKQG